MANFYFDTSALVKFYVQERGSLWVQSLVNPQSANLIFVSMIAEVEAAAAFSRKHRDGELESDLYQPLIPKLRQEFSCFFLPLMITPDLIQRAIELTTRYSLRGYDALQLGTALLATEILLRSSQTPLTFISADIRLNQIAATEKLSVDDPNRH
ncbi:MAG: type II toxin-antitoxin system VapC family toxin [Acidobacteria bacterium]|nr:type II toxin-antitoxin system VapC family toxin [Acidobacteriota bacterium]MBI3658688.1 type II toxin-antitoxin system VapC family toxin [Acidobacteriota bacterium]